MSCFSKLCRRFTGEQPWRSVSSEKMQHVCGTSSGTAILKEHYLVTASIFCSYFKVVHYLSVSLITDALSKAILDPLSVQLFSNVASVIWEGVGWCWRYTPLGFFKSLR